MRIWLAYKFRNTDQSILRPRLEEITSLLESDGHKVFTMIKDIQDWDPDCMPKEEAVKRAIPFYMTCDAGLYIFDTDQPSEGRGFDAGVFVGQNKPTIMAIRKPFTIPFTEALFTQNPANKELPFPCVIRYDNYTDIAAAMRKKE
jgi:hypothetical protein